MTDKVDDVVLSSCSVCEYETEEDNLVTTDYDGLVCDDCAQICNRCDAIGTNNDCYYIVDGDYSHHLLCSSNHYSYLSHHSDYKSVRNHHTLDHHNQ